MEATQVLRQAQRRRRELMDQLHQNYASWRIITGMRGQFLGTSCTAVQLGTGILTAFPYMPHGAPVMDASRFVQPVQQQQQQAQQVNRHGQQTKKQERVDQAGATSFAAPAALMTLQQVAV